MTDYNSAGGGSAIADATVDAALSQFLSFFIAGEEYAVGILRVKEIIEYDVVTRVPAMPPSVRGVINLRGRVVPVVDLALTFGLSESSVTRRSCIVVVEREHDGESSVMGILVDAVSQVLDLRADDIEAPPAFGTRARTELLDGMARSGRKFVMLLNVDRALAFDVAVAQPVAVAEPASDAAEAEAAASEDAASDASRGAA